MMTLKWNKLRTPRFIIAAVLGILAVVACGFLIHMSYPVYSADATDGYSFGSRCLIEINLGLVALAALFLVLVLAGFELILPASDSRLRHTLTFICIMLAPFLLVALTPMEDIFTKSHHDPQRLQELRFGDAGEFLKDADRVTLYSLESESLHESGKKNQPELFHGYRVLGQLEITEKEAIDSIYQDLRGRVYDELGSSDTCCFNPRHGLKVGKGKESMNFLICFQCCKIYVYSSENDDGDYQRVPLKWISDTEEALLLNTLLDKAEISREEQ